MDENQDQLISVRDLRKRKVVDTATAETLGRVRDVVFAPDAGLVVAVEVSGDVSGLLRLNRIIGIGPDAITVTSASQIEQDVEIADLVTDDDALRNRLLGVDGVERGKVRDLLFDPDGGEVRAILSGDDQHDAQLVGIGSYAVVMRPRASSRARA